jgi:predicted Fe-S protein YdhL (DUF1289 family)
MKILKAGCVFVCSADELDLLKALLCSCHEVSSWEDLDEDVKVRGDGGDHR